jgi:uncharacterized protein (TIGR02145 family)
VSPVSITTSAGDVFTITASASGGTNVRYQWYRAMNSGGPYAVITAVSTNSVLNWSESVDGTYYYRVAAWSDCENPRTDPNSNIAVVTVSPECRAVTSVTISPASFTASASASFTITATAVGGTNVRYQWYRATNIGGPYSAISAVTTSNVLTWSEPSEGTYYYRAAAWSDCENPKTEPDSNVSTGTIGPPCNNVTAVSADPSSASVIVGGTFTLTANVTGGTNVQYQWYESSSSGGPYSPISGQTGRTMTLTASVEGTFYYRVEAWSSCQQRPNAPNSNEVTVVVTRIPGPDGDGGFTGRICYDIAYSNDNLFGCGPVSARYPHRTVFSDRTVQDPALGNVRPPYSGVQVYTFKPAGPVSNIRFAYNDPSGKAIESVSGGCSGTYLTGICKVTVYFKASLDIDLRGVTRANALRPEIYAIYNDAPGGGGVDRKVVVRPQLQDCACCGANTMDGGWLNFMCHNLGADESLDPFTWKNDGYNVDADIKGSLFQWGRRADGHQKRNSATSGTQSTTPVPNHPYFITSPDWIKPINHKLWGDGSLGTNTNPPKAANDPCPGGWKVPSQAQWASLYRGGAIGGTPGEAQANRWTWVGTPFAGANGAVWGGYMVGDALYLPAAGYRIYHTGAINYTGRIGYYWTSTPRSEGTEHCYFLHIQDIRVNPAPAYDFNNPQRRGAGHSVRCVEDL